MEVVDLGVGDTQLPENFPCVLAMPRRVGAPARTAFPKTHRERCLGHLFSPGEFSLKPRTLVTDMGVLQGFFERVDGGNTDFIRVKEPEPLVERPCHEDGTNLRDHLVLSVRRGPLLTDEGFPADHAAERLPEVRFQAAQGQVTAIGRRGRR